MKYTTQLSIFTLLTFLLLGCSTSDTAELADEIRAIENGLMPALIAKGTDPVQYSIYDRMEHHKVPGVSMAIVREGKIRWAKGYGMANTETGDSVNTNTIFQAGSISKPVAALAALKLFEEGEVDLDTDVNSYLSGWTVDENEFTLENKVSLRLLLTHSAGMTVHGFPGYTHVDTFPSIVEVLNGEGNTPEIVVDTKPGSIWRYSGGGYTVMEKVVEDVSGLPFEEYLAKNILGPAGMENSTYAQPLPEELHRNASAAYDSEGEIIDGLWHNYPEQAAAGLWTTPTDLAKYCIEVQEILAGKIGGILKPETVEMMMTKHKEGWGLGPSLSWSADSLRFGHGGKNAGFTANLNAFAHTGNAVIIMTGADNGGMLISEILRSVSGYYDLGISKPEVVETVLLSAEQLNSFAGKYKYVDKVPDMGDYFIDIIAEENKLIVIDPNSGDRDSLNPTGETSFVDLGDGDKMEFQTDSSVLGMLWNKRFQFYRVE